MSDKTPARSHTSCVACKSEIPAGAVMCPVCRSHQSRWKNRIYYFASIAGAITVFISLLTYIVSTWPEIRKALFWRDIVEVTEFDSKVKIVLHNSGDGKIFVSHISVRSDERKHASVIFINKTVESKDFLVDDLNKNTVDLGKWGTGSFTEQFWKKMYLDRSLADGDCIQWHLFLPNDPGFTTIKTYLGNGFRTVSIDATLYFHSGRDGRLLSQDMKLMGVPYLKRSRNCGAPDHWIPLPK